MIETTRIHEAAAQLAAELCTDAIKWRYAADRRGHSEHADTAVEGLYPHATIIADDGLEIDVSWNQNNRKSEQFEIKQNYHTAAWVDSDGEPIDPRMFTQGNRIQLPSINVSASKSPQRIATDVRKRVIPDASEVHERALERVAANNAHRRRVSANAVAMGINPTSKRSRSYKTGKPERTVALESAGRSAEIEVDSDGVTINLRDLPVDKAIAVLALLGVEIFPWVLGFDVKSKRTGRLIVTAPSDTPAAAFRVAKRLNPLLKRTDVTIERETVGDA